MSTYKKDPKTSRLPGHSRSKVGIRPEVGLSPVHSLVCCKTVVVGTHVPSVTATGKACLKCLDNVIPLQENSAIITVKKLEYN